MNAPGLKNKTNKNIRNKREV